MINPKLLILVAAISTVLNVAAYNQVECTEQQVDMERVNMENFLKVSSGDAVEFEYVNCTTDEMAEYIGIADKGDQIARFFLDDGYVLLTEGEVNPTYDREEEYRGIKIKLQNGYCWAYINGLTLYGHADRVKKAIDHYKSGNTLNSYVKENGIEQVKDADYVWLMKEGYCPYSHQLKVFWAHYEQGKYNFYRMDEEGEEGDTIETRSFSSFHQVINAEKYRKKTIKIDANMGNKKVGIEVL